MCLRDSLPASDLSVVVFCVGYGGLVPIAGDAAPIHPRLKLLRFSVKHQSVFPAQEEVGTAVVARRIVLSAVVELAHFQMAPLAPRALCSHEFRLVTVRLPPNPASPPWCTKATMVGFGVFAQEGHRTTDRSPKRSPLTMSSTEFSRKRALTLSGATVNSAAVGVIENSEARHPAPLKRSRVPCERLLMASEELPEKDLRCRPETDQETDQDSEDESYLSCPPFSRRLM